MEFCPSKQTEITKVKKRNHQKPKHKSRSMRNKKVEECFQKERQQNGSLSQAYSGCEGLKSMWQTLHF